MKFLKSSIFICLLIILSGCKEKQETLNKKPNVLFVLLDDLGYSDLGCYGGEINTPNIDNLGINGIRYESIYNSARCCPSRAALMTGLYPPQAGIANFTTNKPRKNQGPAYLGHLRDDCVTLGEVLKSQGYGTYYVGKWHMHEKTDPVKRGFDEFYGYDMGYAQDQWDPNAYIRKPEEKAKEIDKPEGAFYATDVFNEYALEFLNQARDKKEEPWFLFLSHSSPHFPVQAPKESVDKYFDTYMKGWDRLREERYENLKNVGLIERESRWTLTGRATVPVDRDIVANGFSGEQNPAWETLDIDRQRDLARRMATFAAMVEHVDKGVGQIVDYLKKTGQFENTIIMITSDNGACYEWGPFGFDGPSRKGITTVHKGDSLNVVGQRGTYSSYGSAWANMCNTPLKLYKHFTHEGGVASPFIVHWPNEIDEKAGSWVRERTHLIDIMPTLCDITGATYPETFKDNAIQPMEGVSLVNTFKHEPLDKRPIYFSHFGAKAVVEGDWKAVWGKNMPYEIEWELYNLKEDRCETKDLAKEYPEKVEKFAAMWDDYSERVGL
ncbi:arylsulfatase [Seonamhaeicola sp.]|uniref:arylsulfatase n=1 Tax=Seonamhaeicola sp. TaxID=1912245 RepID=UPI00261F20FF|nr:arylsulfatase [Seonamhaeicola sp.]